MSYAGDGGGGGGGGRYHNNNNYNNGGGGSSGGRGGNRNGGGGGRYHGGGGGGRYQGGGGGARGGRGGNSSRGGGRGSGSNTNYGLLSLCRDFTASGGQCPRGTSCNFAHVVQLHATVAAATKPPLQQANYKSNYNNHANTPAVATVSSIAIWEPPGNPVFKIFTSSSDGYWRLWNTAGGQFLQEFENNMAGNVHKCIVSYDQTYLFCGFEAPCRAIPSPNITVGMVHGWNLQQSAQPPLELQIQPTASNTTSSGATTPTTANGTGNNATSSNTTSIPYAHNMAVSAIHMAAPQSTTSGGISTTDTIQIATGSRDGSIRLWAYRNGAFLLVRALCGHAREVTGLVLLSAQNILWSASTDQCIRIWNTMTGDCQYCIAGSSVDPSIQQIPNMNSPAAVGHTMPITALIPYVSPAGTFILSSSLDQTVKVWNAVTGECVASESHSEAITCMTIARDLGNNELLLLGMEGGAIQCRNIQPYANIAAFQLIFTLTSYHSGVGHDGAVKCITAGPSGTFYSGGVDGKMLVCSFCGDLGLKA